MKRITLIPAAVVLFALGAAAPAVADEVSDWTRHLIAASLVAPATNPLTMTRNGALVSAAMFDALNGIERRYTPVHVTPDAPRGASRRAAVVQAAYAMMVKLYPAQTADLDQKLAASLAAIAADAATENSQSIARGVAWGQTVADEIWTWRLGDGFNSTPPPFTGGMALGQWRPTPPGLQPGSGVPFSYMTPWAILSPSQFRPAGPQALTSARYAAEFNETKTLGRFDSAARTADQTDYARFWATGTSTALFAPVAIALADERHLVLSEKSRLMALMNLAMADAAIGCWDAKYVYVAWRPITAIPAPDDGNPDTESDPTWTPLINTPNHPEYPSGHSCISGAAGRVLASYFGDTVAVTIPHPTTGVTRSFSSFTEALEEVKNARIVAGIHFRTACDDGQGIGIAVADYALANALQPVNGNHSGQLRD